MRRGLQNLHDDVDDRPQDDDAGDQDGDADDPTFRAEFAARIFHMYVRVRSQA